MVFRFLIAALATALAVPIDTGYSVFEITKYDSQSFEIVAEVIEGTYLGIAFGAVMKKQDMVWFSADESGPQV